MVPQPISFLRWVREHEHELQPPTGGKQVWPDRDFIVTALRGPNGRPDYHDNPTEEFFYQIEGEITVRLMVDGKREDVVLAAGDMLLLPAHVRHSPQRPAGTVGIVLERRRPAGEVDGFEWFCPQCDARVHRFETEMTNLVADVTRAVQTWETSETLRTCGACGHVHPPSAVRIAS